MPSFYRTYESWWGTGVPASNNGAETLVSYAMRFKLTVAGRVLGLRYARDGRTGGPAIGILWSDDRATMLAHVAFRNHAAGAAGFVRWENAYFAKPVHVVAGTIVRAAVTFSGVWFLETDTALAAADVTVGHITALKDAVSPNKNGATGADAEVCAITSSVSDANGVDIIFFPS